ncbi:PREDICTED: coiled-coil domain-containing protein 81-like [Amphimedon queenslandica]|uniref:CCDC81 HU domain-containing protein n=1 Tax=Amphimedon queenslandica TaxID=400682 RepID=A0A1X7U8L2_AMPQE|nr:PREDICTED: coiled-coil domain-containing protein 81-like [Amphimedon queenslandica]|eukprot:XP_011405838.1 PREDICTED: coiled-coil domain-containing protein 81-like [Amphimedon queenslandica]
MAETISTLVAAAKKSKFSMINHLSIDDVLIVWDELADFIEKQMLMTKGVSLHGFGTFTFSQRKIDIGCGKILKIQRPVFVLSENMAQTHSLSYPKQLATGQIPVLSINYTVLSNGTSFSRDTVELCIREILVAFGKALGACKDISLDFPKIGRLMIRDKKCRMRFFKEFITSMDSSGRIKYAFSSNKSQSSEGSVMSEPPCVRLNRTLPKIVEVTNEDSSSEGGSTSTPLPPAIKNSNKPNQDFMSNKDKPTAPHHSPKHETVLPLPSAPSPAGSKTEAKPRSEPLNNDNRPTSSCSHCAGDRNSMCYVCHQRELRNVPIYLAEERKRKEKLHERLLNEFQQKKAALLNAREKAKQLQNFEIAKDAADFNLHSMEKKKLNEMKDSIRNSDYQPSCVFQTRPLTPCYTRKQLEYCQQLDEQVRRRQEAYRTARKREEDFEKKEQNQLTKELAKIKEAYYSKMLERKASYQQALDDQIHLKATRNRAPSPVSQPIFAVQDTATVHTHRDRARKLYHEQLSFIMEKEQKLKSQALQQKKADAQQLYLNLQDYKRDIEKSRKDRIQARKELEEYWQEAARKKQLREESESIPRDCLLQDQCKKYPRCRQCQRKIDNVGASNVLSESRYTAGSRLMI